MLPTWLVGDVVHFSISCLELAWAPPVRQVSTVLQLPSGHLTLTNRKEGLAKPLLGIEHLRQCLSQLWISISKLLYSLHTPKAGKQWVAKQKGGGGVQA